MATRWYLPSDTVTPPISPAFASWSDTSIAYRTTAPTIPRSSAMTTVSFADNNASNRSILFVQFISAELTAGQTVTGSQAVKSQILSKERDISCQLFQRLVIRIIGNGGATVRKTFVTGSTLPNDDVELSAIALTNRQFTTTSEATNYTTVAGDYFVFELGVGGDPDVGSDHDSDIRLGDVAGSDLSEDDLSILDNNPWIEITDTLTFMPISSIMAAARPPLSRTGIGIRRALARRNFREIRAEIMRRAS